MRSGLGEGRDDGRQGCERASRPYCLLVFVSFEIVVPLFSDDLCIGVLDVDSEHLAQFDETDALYLGELAKILEKRFKASRQTA